MKEHYASNFKANQSKKSTAVLKQYGTGLTRNPRENFSVLSYMDGDASRTNFWNSDFYKFWQWTKFKI